MTTFLQFFCAINFELLTAVSRLLSWKLGLQRLKKKSDRAHQAKTNEIHQNGFLVHQRSTA